MREILIRGNLSPLGRGEGVEDRAICARVRFDAFLVIEKHPGLADDFDQQPVTIAMHRFLIFPLTAVWLLLLAVAPAQGDEVTNKAATTFVDTVAANFSTWDTNHDRTLSAEELDGAIEDPANKGPAAAALATLRHAGSVTNVPPLTLANIAKLADDEELKLLTFYNKSIGRIKRVTHRELFVSGLPQLSTIRQGVMGNCFCLAPLGAMVYRDPEEVASWFEVQSNGNVLVKMAAGR